MNFNDKKQKEAFIVAVLKNFFLDLAVDEVEMLCTSYTQELMTERSPPPQKPKYDLDAAMSAGR